MTTPIRLAILTAIVASFAAEHVAAQSLDFATYRAKVEPIFLKKREGHARCVVCHAGAAETHSTCSRWRRARPPGPKNSRGRTSQGVSRLVNAANLMSSPILKHPLAGTAGGDDFHSGGRQFQSKNDPDWKAIEEWARGAKK